MFTGARRREKEHSMKKGALDSPEALAYYYMDNFMCHEPYLKQ